MRWGWGLVELSEASVCETSLVTVFSRYVSCCITHREQMLPEDPLCTSH